MTIRGITLDTGALVAIERRKETGTHLLELAKQRLATCSPETRKHYRPIDGDATIRPGCSSCHAA